MSDKRTYTEINIQKLVSSGLKDENRLSTQHKEVVLNMLLQKIPQPQKKFQPGPVNVIGLSIIWIIIPVLLLGEFHDSIYMLDIIKAALGISLFSIPVSSIILIIIKLKSHEKRMA